MTDTTAAGADIGFRDRPQPLDGNALRAAVLGANDGLVSNFSLIMGVAGASVGNQPVLVAGTAGLLAGSLSMALGEWLSVESSRELDANQIAKGLLHHETRRLGGSAWTAAIVSFVLFGLGAAVPLIPFLIGSGGVAILVSAAVSGAALFGLGAAITVMTGRNPLLAGLRQLAFGLAAAALTFGIGAVLGTTLA